MMQQHGRDEIMLHWDFILAHVDGALHKVEVMFPDPHFRSFRSGFLRAIRVCYIKDEALIVFFDHFKPQAEWPNPTGFGGFHPSSQLPYCHDPPITHMPLGVCDLIAHDTSLPLSLREYLN
jgi:hypothetical protein